MTDSSIASIGRQLAEALMTFAHDRDPGSKQEVARLHTELCAAIRAEIAAGNLEQDTPPRVVEPEQPPGGGGAADGAKHPPLST